MAVEIDIDGNRVTLNDVATEETLRRVVDAIERQGGNSGGVGFVKEQVELKQKYPSKIRAFPVVLIDDEFVGGLVETAKIFLKKGLVKAPSS